MEPPTPTVNETNENEEALRLAEEVLERELMLMPDSETDGHDEL